MKKSFMISHLCAVIIGMMLCCCSLKEEKEEFFLKNFCQLRDFSPLKHVG